MNTPDAKSVLETALLCAAQPLTLPEMRALFADEVGPDTVKALLEDIARDWQGRGVELVALAQGWRFQSRPQMQLYLDRLHAERPPRYSRAVMETLAIIAYRQPVTRGDIEDIRGVTVSAPVIKQLEDRGWIEAIGYREAPGRPALFATTKRFLDDLGLHALDQLPAIDGRTGPQTAALTGAAVAELLPAQAELLLGAVDLPVAGEDAPGGAAETPLASTPDASRPAAYAETPPHAADRPPPDLAGGADLETQADVAEAVGDADVAPVAAPPDPSSPPTDAPEPDSVAMERPS